MIGQALVQDIEKRATALGLSVNELCRRAGMWPSTFHRWKSGETQPQVRLLEKLDHVLSQAEHDKAAPASAAE